jgi:hypothetical protein
VEHGAQWLWAGAVHLEPAVRDWFLEALSRHFPRVVPGYARVYGAASTLGGARYAPRRYADALAARVADLKARYGLAERRRPTGASIPTLPGTPTPEVGSAQQRAQSASGCEARQMALPL